MEAVAKNKAIAIVVNNFNNNYQPEDEFEFEINNEQRQKQKELELQRYIEKIDAEIYVVREKLRGSQGFKAILKDLDNTLKDTLIKNSASVKEFYLPKNKQYVKLEREAVNFRFNSAKLKQDLPDIYEKYTEQKASQLKISFRDATADEEQENKMADMFQNAETTEITLHKEVSDAR